jgi:hypothetical protein
VSHIARHRKFKKKSTFAPKSNPIMEAQLEQLTTLEEVENMSIHDQLALCGVEFDADGKPILFTHEEVFQSFARKLVAFYGEDIRPALNDSLASHNLSRI